MLASPQQIYYFQIKGPRKADEEVDFSVGLKGGRVSKVKTNKWAHLRNGGWVSWGPKRWQHISAMAPQDTAEATQAGNLPPKVTRGPRIRQHRLNSQYRH